MAEFTHYLPQCLLRFEESSNTVYLNVFKQIDSHESIVTEIKTSDPINFERDQGMKGIALQIDIGSDNINITIAACNSFHSQEKVNRLLNGLLR